MSFAFLQLLPLAIVLFLLQGLAAIPWLAMLTRSSPRRDFSFFAKVVGGTALAGLPFAFLLESNSDPSIVALWGRFYAAILTLQIGFDFFILTYYALLNVWPKGGAVALAAFQESVRQPMFWMLTILGGLVMAVSIVIPYFTFGEDLKMVKEISYALTMILPAIFGVISASISVSEEIEGRTAVTLLSKPVTRREFLFGKFLGITLAGLFMTMFLSWILIWVVLAKFAYDFQPGITQIPPDPAWLTDLLETTYGPTISGDLLRGVGLWFRDTGDALPGLIIGFGQVMTLIAISVALATRVPMVVNITMCFVVIYPLGHLAPIMTEVSQRLPVGQALVHFFAQLLELLLPGLAMFDVSSAIVRDVPLDPQRYSLYTFNVVLYASMYTAIALLAGLILFEDRDVA
jgi:ABC-type transport system involved in multi-copper enzyme maturation permease subunit